MLRMAVACAASTLSVQQSITLHSLMASYNLATLYRDGFRYGKHMWPVELMMYLSIDRTSYSASCTARPRLPQSRSLRPPASMFHPSSFFPTLAQAVIHLTSMTVGVNYGSKLQSGFAEKKKGPIIRSFQTAQSGNLAKLANAFASQSKSEDQEEEKTGIFGRPPFRPNYETNIVFVFSVLQAAVSSLINHKGKPFYGSILESRPLCLSAGVAVLFAVACMAETFPFINDFLELRRMPSRQSKLILLSIAFADVALCVLCRFLSSQLLDSKEVQEVLPYSDLDIAADAEEKLLGEESKQNRNLVLIMFSFMVHMLAEVLFSG
jgi:magnesium-transporting ATPase (P-type)